MKSVSINSFPSTPSSYDPVSRALPSLRLNSLRGLASLIKNCSKPSIETLVFYYQMLVIRWNQRFFFLQSMFDPYLAAIVSNPKSDKIVRKVVSNHNLTASIISEHPRLVFFFGLSFTGIGVKGKKHGRGCFQWG